MLRWLTCKVPAGCSTMPASDGSSCRSETSSLTLGGSTVFQLVVFSISPAEDGHDRNRRQVVLGSSPQVKSMPISMEKKKNESDAVPWTCHGVGPDSVHVDADAVDADAEHLDRELPSRFQR